MIPRLFVLALASFGLARAHGDHTFDLEDQDDSLMSYAERHVSCTKQYMVSRETGLTSALDAHGTPYRLVRLAVILQAA